MDKSTSSSGNGNKVVYQTDLDGKYFVRKYNGSLGSIKTLDNVREFNELVYRLHMKEGYSMRSLPADHEIWEGKLNKDSSNYF